MKAYLQKVIKDKEARAKELRAKIKASEDINEVRGLGDTLELILAELQEAKDKLAECEAQSDNADNGENMDGGAEAASRSANMRGASFNPLASYSIATAQNNGNVSEARENDPRGTMEYRTAFMDYVRTGKMSQVLEKRADTQNAVADLGVLIPSTIVQEIIKDTEKIYGQLYSRVKKTNVAGGIKYPIGAFSATFNRLAETGAPTDRQKGGSITGYIEFGYNIGEIRLSQTLLMSVMGVTVFETELSNAIVEAYIKAMDNEIMTGVATNNQFAGILTEANKTSGGKIAAANIIEFTAEDVADWTKWQEKLFAAIPLSMRKERPEFVMTANTFEANIETLKDSNGQPVAREIFNPVNGDESATFKGRNVVFVEDDILENFNDAGAGEYFGMYWVPEKAYAVNSNMEFAVTRYFDNDKNEYVQKALVINDGKILDPKYIYLLKKKVNA